MIFIALFVFFSAPLSASEDSEISEVPEPTIAISENPLKYKDIRPTSKFKQEENQKRQEELKKKIEEQLRAKQIEKEAEKKRLEVLKESRQASREAFKKNLEKIRDENKQQILEKLDGKMKEVNVKQTGLMQHSLDKLSTILNEMSVKAASASAQGADTGGFDAAFASAEAAITEAREKIVSQAAKEYIVSITTEDALLESVGATRSQLESDLHTTRESVKRAKDAVKTAARELSRIRKFLKITISPSISPAP